MDRRKFVKTLIGVAGLTIAWKGARKMSKLNLEEKTNLMPSLFVGHGSPMNIGERNDFTKTMKSLGDAFSPKAILVISAHWLEKSSIIQNASEQKTIHDFYGFPKELFEINYPAHGWGDDLVKRIENLGIKGLQVTSARGLDHGTWAVLYHMYPQANIPVVQLSISKGLPFSEYFELGQTLGELREHGVMILGSGNIVHNLQKIDWNMDAPPFDWAVEFDNQVENHINSNQFEKLLTIDSDEKELFNLAHPTTEHYIPLAYILGAARHSDNITYPCSFIQNGSMSMRSVLFTG